MTITISKTKLIAVVATLSLLIPGAAYAVHSFPDTPDTAFYHDAVEWALANEITKGCNGGTGFCGQDGVTRGENITFAQRYDVNVVQPALTALQADADAAQAAADAAQAAADTKAEAADVYTQAEVDAAVAAVRTKFTQVESDGTITSDQNNGATAVSHTATSGTYFVTFDSDISSCAYVATPANQGSAPEFNQVGIQASAVGGGTQIFVQTANAAGVLTDSGFFLVVTC